MKILSVKPIYLIPLIALLLFGASCTKEVGMNTNTPTTNTNNTLVNSRTTGTFSTISTNQNANIAAARITLTSSGLDQPGVSIVVGQSVEFLNLDTVDHNIKSTNGHQFDHLLSPGESFVYQSTVSENIIYADGLDVNSIYWRGSISVK